MECLEDGECPSSPEELHPNSDMEQNGVATQPIYTPLPRPQVSSTSNQSSRDTNVQPCKNTPKLLGSLKLAPLTCSTTNQIDPHVNCTFSSSNSDSSEDDSDSDSQKRQGWPSTRVRGKKSRKLRMQYPSHAEVASLDGGDDFRNAAAAYQNSLRANNGALPTSSFSGGERRKVSASNNVWGSILREDALTSELTGIAVGRKSIKDLNSDRGAEVIRNFILKLLCVLIPS